MGSVWEAVPAVDREHISDLAGEEHGMSASFRRLAIPGEAIPMLTS